MAFSGYKDLDPGFSTGLQALLAARPGITINSGYRDVVRQGQLWEAAVKKYGSPEAARKWVAPPGSSYHNKRLAADLGFASDEDRAWAHANAGKFNLKFPLGNEDWHIELASTRGGGEPTGAVAAAPADSAAPQSAGAGYFDTLADSGFDISAATPEDTSPKLIRGKAAPPPEIMQTPSAMPQQAAAAAVPPLPGATTLEPLADLFKVAQIGRPKDRLPSRDGRTPLPTIGYG